MKHKQGIPPGPNGSFWFGCLKEMRKDPMLFFTRVALEYGGISRIRFGRNKYSYLVSEPALIRELLVDNASKYMKNVRYKHLRTILGEGLLLSEGATWKRQRKILRPAFRQVELLSQVAWSSKTIAGFLDRFETVAADGTAIDIEPYFARLSQLVAGTWLMGEPFRARADRIADIWEEATATWPDPPRSALASYRVPSPRKVLTLKRCMSAFNRYIYEIIKIYEQSPVGENGLIPLLVEGHKRATGTALSNQQLRDQLVTLFIAAHETSGSSLCWIHYFLSRYPEIRARVQQEVDQQLQGNLPTDEDIPKLQYLKRVINESLRIYSPIHSLSRLALEDNTIGSYTIPKGATVTVSLFATHRLPKHWDNPEAFDPERFTKENSARRHPFAFIPFAAGHRNCIGTTFATIQSKLVISQIAQRFSIDLLPGHSVEPMPSTTMRPHNGMWVRIRKSEIADKQLSAKKLVPPS